jgi:hypothetical protein
MHSWLYTNFRGVWKSNGIICTGFIRVCIYQIFQICLTGCKTGCKARQFRTIQLYKMSFLFSFILYIIHFCSLSLSCSETICSFYILCRISLLKTTLYWFTSESTIDNSSLSRSPIMKRQVYNQSNIDSYAGVHAWRFDWQAEFGCMWGKNKCLHEMSAEEARSNKSYINDKCIYGLCCRILAISYLDHIVHYVSTIYTVNVNSICTCLICSFEEQFFYLSILLPLFLVHKSQHQT